MTTTPRSPLPQLGDALSDLQHLNGALVAAMERIEETRLDEEIRLADTDHSYFFATYSLLTVIHDGMEHLRTRLTEIESGFGVAGIL